MKSLQIMRSLPRHGCYQTRLGEAWPIQATYKDSKGGGTVLVASFLFLVRLNTTRSGWVQDAYGAWNGGEGVVVQCVWFCLLHTTFLYVLFQTILRKKQENWNLKKHIHGRVCH